MRDLCLCTHIHVDIVSMCTCEYIDVFQYVYLYLYLYLYKISSKSHNTCGRNYLYLTVKEAESQQWDVISQKSKNWATAMSDCKVHGLVIMSYFFLYNGHFKFVSVDEGCVSTTFSLVTKCAISISGVWQSQCTESAAVILGGGGNVIWRESKPSDSESRGGMQWVGKKIPPSEVGKFRVTLWNGFWNHPLLASLIQSVYFDWKQLPSQNTYPGHMSLLRKHSLWNDVWGNTGTFQVPKCILTHEKQI